MRRCLVGLPIEGSGPFGAFLLFAIAGFATAVILGIHSCLGSFSQRDQVSSTTNSVPKENPDESFSSRPAV